ncbi:MAG TPA: glycerol-3-phosphate 1-O-acyltransferase PlsY [Terriglobales bacterium]|jgi:acyl phosphate:glycerol-3-phosphate acyltransferase|nr:glycerol-3-phosphate 1-O-acyltransferase PlsY [Terriglobales bacterium]
MIFLLIAVVAYLLGSIPFGYLLVRVFRGEDVRHSGSGNIGATNVARSSPVLGLLTLSLDASKGGAAVLIAARFQTSGALYSIESLAALFAILGHLFPVWLKFRGGKGVATALGSFVIIAPKSILCVIGIFALVFLVFRYVSLSSVIAVACFPVTAWLLGEYGKMPSVLIIMSVAALLVVSRHHSNLGRLMQGTEPRFRRSV